MKCSIRIFSVFFLLAASCFAIGIAALSFAHSDFQNNPTSSQEKIISDLYSKLYCHTSSNERPENKINTLQVRNFTNLFNGFWANIQAIEKVIETELSQYTLISRSFLIKYRTIDIIFPFHHFW